MFPKKKFDLISEFPNIESSIHYWSRFSSPVLQAFDLNEFICVNTEQSVFFSFNVIIFLNTSRKKTLNNHKVQAGECNGD